ncbi:MAG TPA: 4a-hydroxytetrahydrobiopterin dehydratase [Planctomycetota bacterium]|nr:4a-hydroxytetrahydrobiopterin dehydratase [Planctomycetota bacterium]
MARPPVAASALGDDAVRSALAGMPGWSGSIAGLERQWRFLSHPAAIAFIQACVAGVEARNHHPEWHNVYDRVSVRLRTHDAGDRVTGQDLDLARYLDQQARAHGEVNPL